jgi:hypothetical protein
MVVAGAAEACLPAGKIGTSTGDGMMYPEQSKRYA